MSLKWLIGYNCFKPMEAIESSQTLKLTCNDDYAIRDPDSVVDHRATAVSNCSNPTAITGSLGLPGYHYFEPCSINKLTHS